MSAKRYHFIIKADGNSIAGYNKTCAGCGDALLMTDSRWEQSFLLFVLLAICLRFEGFSFIYIHMYIYFI